jgi:hypothetical protein
MSVVFENGRKFIQQYARRSTLGVRNLGQPKRLATGETVLERVPEADVFLAAFPAKKHLAIVEYGRKID